MSLGEQFAVIALVLLGVALALRLADRYLHCVRTLPPPPPRPRNRYGSMTLPLDHENNWMRGCFSADQAKRFARDNLKSESR